MEDTEPTKSARKPSQMSSVRANEAIALIRSLLDDEVRGDVESAMTKLHADYSMTWVYKHRNGELFPFVDSHLIAEEMRDVYGIRGRQYSIRHIVSSGDVVMAELVESYPDPSKGGKVYRTPMVIVWEMKDGKVKTGRHYCDPQLSYLNLTEDAVDRMYRADRLRKG